MTEISLKRKKIGKKGPGHGFSAGRYWDIFVKGRKNPVGFVGYAIGKQVGVVGGESYFVQIYIKPSWRGKGIATRAEDMLAELEGIKELNATILVDNKASKKAHEKAGWKHTLEVYEKSYR